MRCEGDQFTHSSLRASGKRVQVRERCPNLRLLRSTIGHKSGVVGSPQKMFPNCNSPPGRGTPGVCVRKVGRDSPRRHGAEQLSVDWQHFANGRGRFDRINRINRMPTCCINGENHPVDPVDPVQSSDQHGSRAFSHMWSSPCLRGEFLTAAYFCDAHTDAGNIRRTVRSRVTAIHGRIGNIQKERASVDGWGRGRSPGFDPTRIDPGHTPSHTTLALFVRRVV